MVAVNLISIFDYYLKHIIDHQGATYLHRHIGFDSK